MARLKLSVGAGARRPRPMTPIEVATAMREFAAETGETTEGIAKRLRVHPVTCRRFLAILDLPPDWRGIWRFGRADSSGRLPFSMGAMMGPRFADGTLSKDDLDLLKRAALDPGKPARSDDIANILSCRLKNPDKPISECIREIMMLTPRRVSSYVIITDIDPSLAAAKDAVAEALSARLPEGSVKDLRIRDGMHVWILLTRAGYDGFYRLAEKTGVMPKDLVKTLCSEYVRSR